MVSCIPYFALRSNLKGVMHENKGTEGFRLSDPKFGGDNIMLPSAFTFFLNALDNMLHSSLCKSPFSHFSSQTVIPHLKQSVTYMWVSWSDMGSDRLFKTGVP